MNESDQSSSCWKYFVKFGSRELFWEVYLSLKCFCLALSTFVCRFIQQKLESASTEDKEAIFQVPQNAPSSQQEQTSLGWYFGWP